MTNYEWMLVALALVSLALGLMAYDVIRHEKKKHPR
jgi:hypothetical protein